MSEQPTLEQEGVLTRLSNAIFPTLDNGGRLETGMSPTCKCSCCKSYLLYDCDNKLVADGEDLFELILDCERKKIGWTQGGQS